MAINIMNPAAPDQDAFVAQLQQWLQRQVGAPAINQQDAFFVPVRQWNRQNIMQAVPQGGGVGNIIPLGAPDFTAQQYAEMINQMANLAQSGGYGVPEPVGNISLEEYLTLLDTFQNMRNQINVDKRAAEAKAAAQSVFQQLLAMPELKLASQTAQQGGMDWDLYERMRASEEAQFNPVMREAAIAAAAGGLAGSSDAALAANQIRAQRAANIANLYPAALQAAEQLRSSAVQRMLAPASLQAQIGAQYVGYLTDILRALSGSPDAVLNVR